MKQDKPKVEYRISVIEGILMIAVAVIYEAAQWALTLLWGVGVLASPIITLWSNLTFGFWFTLRDISFWRRRRALVVFGVNIIKWIPGLNLLPSFTVGVILLWLNTRAEDVLNHIKQ